MPQERNVLTAADHEHSRFTIHWQIVTPAVQNSHQVLL